MPPGGFGSPTSLSNTLLPSPHYTLAGYSIPCAHDLASHAPLRVQCPSACIIAVKPSLLVCAHAQIMSCADTSAQSLHDTYIPTSHGLSFAILSWRFLLPLGAFLRRNRPLSIAGTAEPFQVSPAEPV